MLIMWDSPRATDYLPRTEQGPNLSLEYAGFGQTRFTDLIFSCAYVNLALLDLCCQKGMDERLRSYTQS